MDFHEQKLNVPNLLVLPLIRVYINHETKPSTVFTLRFPRVSGVGIKYWLKDFISRNSLTIIYNALMLPFIYYCITSFGATVAQPEATPYYCYRRELCVWSQTPAIRNQLLFCPNSNIHSYPTRDSSVYHLEKSPGHLSTGNHYKHHWLDVWNSLYTWEPETVYKL